jgi:septin family protein
MCPPILTQHSILVIGTRNSGKTSFLNFLRSSLALPAKKRGYGHVDEAQYPQSPIPPSPANSGFISHYLETEIDGERVGLTLWDSQGLEKNVVDLQLRETSAFLESKFEDTFTEEMKVVRAPGVQDTHIHCAFLLLDPVRLDSNIAAAKSAYGTMNGHYASTNSRIVGSLDEDLDLQILRTLQGKTTVVPVISKADTITAAHMTQLKKSVWDSLKKANLDPLEALGLDDFDGSGSSNRSSRIDERDEDEASDGGSILIRQSTDELTNTLSNHTTSPNSNHHKRISSGSLRNLRRSASPKDGAVNGTAEAQTPYLPLSVISPDMYDPGTIGRKFPWGFADPYNDEHCDFVRLKDAVFTEWRGELREASRELWYEGWRTSRLKKRGGR